MRYAVVIGSKVIDTTRQIVGLVYPAEAQFVECDEVVQRGWGYVDAEFVNPNPPSPPPEPPTLEELQQQKEREVQNFVKAASELAVRKYGKLERTYWPDKERSAKRYLMTQDSDTLTLELKVEAERRGISHTEISEIVLTNAQELRGLLGQLISFRWYLEADIIPELEYESLEELNITEEWGKWLSQD